MDTLIPHTFLPDQRTEAIVTDALAAAGWPEEDINRIMASLHRLYRRTPLPKTPSPRQKSFTTNRKTVGPIILERMTELWENPVMSLSDIASALSLSISTTRRLALDLNLPKRKSGPKVGAMRSE